MNFVQEQLKVIELVIAHIMENILDIIEMFLAIMKTCQLWNRAFRRSQKENVL